MSNASYTNKSAGDYINAETMNKAFDSIEAGSASGMLDRDNFADECIGAKGLERLGVCSHRITVENTNALTGSTSGSGQYAGGALHMISHGSANPLEIVFDGGAGVALNEGDVLRVEWSQYIHSVDTLDAISDPVDIDWATIFLPVWDLGAGYTTGDISVGPTAWMAAKKVRHGRSTQAGFRAQHRRHARGSGVYIVPAGANRVMKFGLGLILVGSSTRLLTLGQGSITAMIYRR